MWNKITEKRFKEWNETADRKKWESVEEMYSSFKTVFDECRDAAVPKRTFKYNDRWSYPPWLNDVMREIKKKLNRALTPLFGNGAGAHGIGEISGVLIKIGKFDIVRMYDVSLLD